MNLSYSQLFMLPSRAARIDVSGSLFVMQGIPLASLQQELQNHSPIMGRPNIYAHLSDFTQLLWMTCSPLVLPFLSLGASFSPLPSDFYVAFHISVNLTSEPPHKLTLFSSHKELWTYSLQSQAEIFSRTVNLWGRDARQPTLRSWAQGKSWGSGRLLKLCKYCLQVVCRKYPRPPADCSSTKYFKKQLWQYFVSNNCSSS